ncbi:MAG: hypothetical protein QG564_947 [Campylobacterota bacterium]|nr:hypothetical protein [Campylobacterota bacterium]
MLKILKEKADSVDIDFIILWVDGTDPDWVEEYHKFSSGSGPKNTVFYRDWDNLHYIFRAFEKFTPWVRQIHFVTWGHLPKWLNVDHPKLNIVRHEDILDGECLPVFNSNAIEPNIHRIQGLSEHFVLFNDDLFITAALSPERFFQNGLPTDACIMNTLSSSSGVGHFVLNNLEILNRHFDKKTAMKKNLSKWFHIAYGKELLRSLFLLPWPRFTGFVDHHQPQPFLKSTFKEVWEKEKEILKQTSASRFRNCNDINQYLFRYWQFIKGSFVPISLKDTQYVTLDMDELRSGKVTRLITANKYSMICLNDGESIRTEEEFEEAKTIIKEAFETILPEKSSFEV